MQFIKNFFINNEERIIKAFFTIITIFSIYAGLIISSKYFGVNFVFFNNSIQSGVSNTGIIQTGSISTGVTNGTGTFSEDDYNTTLNSITGTVDRIRYIMSFGENGVDYFKQDTQPQTLLLGNTKSLNNTLLHSFLQKYQYTFSISPKSYLAIITQKPIPYNKDLLMAINGVSIGVFNKSLDSKYFLSDLVKDSNDVLYIFPIDTIKIVQPDRKIINLLDYGNKINISLAIGQNGNSVQSITIIEP